MCRALAGGFLTNEPDVPAPEVSTSQGLSNTQHINYILLRQYERGERELTSWGRETDVSMKKWETAKGLSENQIP